jgi:transposase
MAGAKKKARSEGRTIVFVDESGLSTRPHRVRTWAPRGETPVLQETFNWKKLSLIAGLTYWNFFFRLHDGAIRGPQAAAFLQALARHLPGKLLVIWDGAAIHRSKPVKAVLAEGGDRIWLARLPAYAPELNPVEYLWSHLKEKEIANLIARDAWELSFFATRALRRMRRRPRIITACWKQFEFQLGA